MLIQALFWGLFVGLEALTIRVTDPWLEARGPVGVFVRYRYLHALRAALTLFCLWLAARYVDQRPFADYGLRWGKTGWSQLAFGFVLGLAAVSLRPLVALGSGAVRIVEVAHAPSGIAFFFDLITALVAMFLLGFTEEGMTRAHPMKNLAEGLSSGSGDAPPSWCAPAVILIPSFGFAYAHSINGGNYWVNAFFFLWCFGVIFGCIYYVTGNLAFPIGLHAAWDFGNIFLFRSDSSNDCYLFRFESVSGGRGPGSLNDNFYLILLMAFALIWLAARISRPGFRSPLLPLRKLSGKT